MLPAETGIADRILVGRDSDARLPAPRHSVGAVSTGPETVRFCMTCGASMATMTVHGVDRRVCDGCRRIHYADPKVAVGVAVARDGRLLLVRRTMEPGRGQWSLPGGYVDAGEHPRA